MIFQPSHYGLFFDAAQLHAAPGRATYAAAFARLQDPLPAQPLAAAQGSGLRYRLGDPTAAAAGNAALAQIRLPETAELETLMQAVGMLYAAEMLRDTLPQAYPWESELQQLLAETHAPLPESPLRRYWTLALWITAGIYLEDADLFERGVAQFERTIAAGDIHPDGYFRFIPTGKSGKTYLEQMQAVCALTLAAEAATLAGTNLWAVENRGVSVVTSTAYLVYFYFYPEKWRWEDSGTLTTENTAALFREWGAFIEIVVARAALRGVEFLLEQQRPFYSVYAGGHTTLTHGKDLAMPKKRGWFGR
jgi:hypothetical protein